MQQMCMHACISMNYIVIFKVSLHVSGLQQMQHNVSSVHYQELADHPSNKCIIICIVTCILNYTSNSQITCTATNATCMYSVNQMHAYIFFSVIIINLLDKLAHTATNATNCCMQHMTCELLYAQFTMQ